MRNFTIGSKVSGAIFNKETGNPVLALEDVPIDDFNFDPRNITVNINLNVEKETEKDIIDIIIKNLKKINGLKYTFVEPNILIKCKF